MLVAYERVDYDRDLDAILEELEEFLQEIDDGEFARLGDPPYNPPLFNLPPTPPPSPPIFLPRPPFANFEIAPRTPSTRPPYNPRYSPIAPPESSPCDLESFIEPAEQPESSTETEPPSEDEEVGDEPTANEGRLKKRVDPSSLGTSP